MIADQFIGTWELIPFKSRSQFGSIPLNCIYTISYLDAMGTLKIAMDWTDGSGQPFSGDYEILPNGIGYEKPGQDGVDQVMSELKGMRTLNTTAFHKGLVVSFASREIMSDGTMKIVQQGKNPQGMLYENVQFYRKVK